MPPVATDWTTISALATGAGTLVLAIATFAAVWSAMRSNKVALAALREQRQPIFSQSRFDDPVQKINFVEGHWVKAAGGRAVAEHIDGTVYLAINLRNVGSGIGVCQQWAVRRGPSGSRDFPTHMPEDRFRSQSRDLYIPPNDVGMWQGALRNPNDSIRAQIGEAIDAREQITIELLYSDLVGEQRTITRFGLTPFDDSWIASIARHWYLEGSGPRRDRDQDAAAAAVRRDQDAAQATVVAANADGTAAVDGSGQVGEDGQAAEQPQPSAPQT